MTILVFVRSNSAIRCDLHVITSKTHQITLNTLNNMHTTCNVKEIQYFNFSRNTLL